MPGPLKWILHQWLDGKGQEMSTVITSEGTRHGVIHQNNIHILNLLSKKYFTIVINAVKDKEAYICILKGIFLEQKYTHYS
jgi:hypothetical protein